MMSIATPHLDHYFHCPSCYGFIEGGIVSSFIVPLLATFSLAFGDADAPRPMFTIYQDHVKPAHAMEYEQSTKSMIEFLKKDENRSKHLSFRAVSTDNFVYSYITPIENYGTLDEIEKAWGSMFAGMDEAMQKSMMEAMNTVESYNTFVIAARPELSFWPENAKVKPDDAAFVHYSFYYLKPGQEEAFEGICKGYKAMLGKRGSDMGFSIFQKASGENLPAYAVIHYGKSQSEIMAYFESFMANVDEEAQKLMVDSLSTIRAHETLFGMVRPDLSLE